jgi:hypothetical protein
MDLGTLLHGLSAILCGHGGGEVVVLLNGSVLLLVVRNEEHETVRNTIVETKPLSMCINNEQRAWMRQRHQQDIEYALKQQPVFNKSTVNSC